VLAAETVWTWTELIEVTVHPPVKYPWTETKWFIEAEIHPVTAGLVMFTATLINAPVDATIQTFVDPACRTYPEAHAIHSVAAPWHPLQETSQIKQSSATAL